MKKMKDRKMNLIRRILVGMLTVVMLFGICFSGVQIPAFADELYQNTIEQEFDQAVTLLCMQYRTFTGSEADRELLDMELESLQTQIEKAENVSDAARQDLLDRLSEYAPEKKEDASISFYGSGPLRTTGSTSVETKSLSFTKTVVKKSADNDLYDLTLTLSGAQGIQTNKAKVDIVLVIDRSDSMHNVDSGNEDSRFILAKNAATELVEEVNRLNNTIDARFNVITFNGSDKSSGGQDDGHMVIDKYIKSYGWHTAAQAITDISQIETPQDHHYTNYDGAFRKTATVLEGKRTGATTVVVFLTDGNPTIRTTYIDHDGKNDNGIQITEAYVGAYKSYDIGYGNGMDVGINCNNIRRNMDAAILQLKTFSVDRFYFVGFGAVLSDNIDELAREAITTYKESITPDKINNLTETFKNIALDITTFLCDQVTLTDTLSHTVPNREIPIPAELLVNIEGGVEVSVIKTDTNGTVVCPRAVSVTTPSSDYNSDDPDKSQAENKAARTITASYDKDKHQLKLNFPASYKLEPNYIYRLHAVIEPTETAYEIYRNKMIEGEQGYPVRGEAGTGTHASNNGNSDISTTYGFQSNDGAVVTYNYKGVQSQQAYAYPVVQLKPGKLIVTKSVVTDEKLTDAQLAEMEANTKFDIHLDFPPKVGEEEDDSVTMDRIIALSDSAVATPEDYLDKVAFTKAAGSPVESGGKFTYNYTLEIPYLSPDTVCTVEEIGASLTNFAVKSSMQVDNVGQEGLEAEVTIPRGGTKNVAYSNEYSPSTTKLTVEKTVAGNMGDWNQDFTYTVSLNNNAISMNGITYKKYEISNGKDTEIASGTITSAQITDNPITYAPFSFKLKHNQKIVFENVPMNATVIVDEAVEGTKYDAYIDGAPNKSQYGVYEHKAPLPKDGLTVKYKNVYEENIDTGVLTDSVPMVVLLSVSLAAAFLLIRRRRFN